MSAERGDGEDADVLVWAQATRAAIASHGRDVLALMPWAPHLAAALAPFATARRKPARRSGCCCRPRPARPSWPITRGRPPVSSPRSRWAPRTGRRTRTRSSTHLAALRRRPGGQALGGRLAVRGLSRDALFEAMQFGFLFDATRKIFSIGYRVTDGSLDPAAYDLLASEARLASFIAIAKGDVPASHWFRLGRPMTPVELGAALVSWSGSMFEYLMPALVMDAPPASLLAQTARLVVRRQMSYGAEHGVPWGISESAYNVRDLDLTYQYSNFGVPGLGLERGLSEDLVIAPYATALAAMVDPVAAARNFRRSTAVGARGALGFYEALDYTRIAPPGGRTGGRGARLHGAPSGHDAGRARQRAARRRDARALPRRAHRSGHRAAAAGARPAGRRGRSSPGRRGRGAGARPRVRRAGLSPVHLASRPDSTARTCSPTGATR